jgi:hypothetical protein
VSDQPPWDSWQTQGQQCPPQQPYGQPPYGQEPYPQGQSQYGLRVPAPTSRRPEKGNRPYPPDAPSWPLSPSLSSFPPLLRRDDQRILAL